MTTARTDEEDIQALAKGGRTNVFGFVLRLAARIPFLFIAGRLYGPEALGRFAYAILIVEFAAQLGSLGLRRGLAELLSKDDRPHAHIIADCLLAAMVASALGAAFLIALPQFMFPNSGINGFDRFLPLAIFAIVVTDISLSALAYKFDILSTVRARAVVEPWTISIAAGVFYFYSARDGLILAYIASLAAALVFALWPLWRSYGLPRGWRPSPTRSFGIARRNLPLAAADAAEWGSRRLDLAILGLFAAPAVVGIYYVAQQVASLPQKLKTSFDPILGPVITRNLQTQNYAEIAKQVGQVGFWIIAAQAGIALALGIPGEAVMGLVGPQFVGGAMALAFLLAAEVTAATAVVSESALVYMARHRNLLISLGMLMVQALVSVGLIILVDDLPIKPEHVGLYQAAAVACGLTISLGIGSLIKSRLLSHLLGQNIRVWRWPLLIAVAAAALLGFIIVSVPARFEWVELTIGIPAILGLYGWIVWRWGFGPEDRVLFRKKRD
ncbi:MAG: lipopolysaccharide biosynthesis protein [Sphingorhabdus sp.]|uniref:lipopolysaccharide biosynthesis protein n=1 Tax=Sphingorhabdus sp. TaxID=1902408 RepID=UPI0025DC4B4C|nr:oligosaccharide flippase family protein [Sphingorhabdus sp.]MCO4090474.1 lipopolysaccharide biosynthesis protein [Sphingorhabdus sp.]